MQNLARALRSQLQAGDEIIVTVSDHESNIGPWSGWRISASLSSSGIWTRTHWSSG